MDDVDVGHEELVGVISGVEVCDDPFADHGRRIAHGRDRLNGPVFVVRDVVKGRDVDAADVGGRLQELLPGRALPLVFFVEVEKVHHDLFPVAEHEEVEKVRDGLRVAGAGAAAHDEVFKAVPVFREQRHAAEFEHVETGREGHLVLEREPDEVELRKRRPRLEREEGQTDLAHLFLHVEPGREDPLAVGVLPLVDEVVEDLDAEVGHADLIGVGETEREPHVDRRRVFFDAVQFPADVAAGLLHERQDLLESSVHSVSTSLGRKMISLIIMPALT